MQDVQNFLQAEIQGSHRQTADIKLDQGTVGRDGEHRPEEFLTSKAYWNRSKKACSGHKQTVLSKRAILPAALTYF